MKRGKSRESSAAANKKPRRNPTAAPAPAAQAADNTGTYFDFSFLPKLVLNNNNLNDYEFAL